MIVDPPSVFAVTTTELTIRMVVGLAVVGLLLLVLNRVTRRILDGRSGSRPAITIRHQQRLDRNASVTLLTAGDRNLLVGTAGQSIVLLAEGDDLADGAPEGDGEARTAGRSVSAPGSASASGSGATPRSDPARAGSVDLRARRRANPIRALQNRTVRRG